MDEHKKKDDHWDALWAELGLPQGEAAPVKSEPPPVQAQAPPVQIQPPPPPPAPAPVPIEVPEARNFEPAPLPPPREELRQEPDVMVEEIEEFEEMEFEEEE